MASSEETPADIISENQESEQPESEESSEAFNCEGLDHCYDTEDNLDRHLTDGEWSPCDHIVCPHRYSGSTNFELAEWALYPASWQESLEFSTWFLSRGLLPEPHNLTALPVDTGLNSWVPSVAASALQSQVHTPVESFAPTLPHDLSHLFEEEEEVSELLDAPSQEEEPTPLPPLPVSVSEFFEPEQSLSEPLVSVEEDQFFDLYIATAAMSEPKSESVPVLSRASEYKVWRAKMMGYLIFIEADDALYAGDMKDAAYKKANARASGTILMRTDISLHHLLVSTVDGVEKKKSAAEMWSSLETHFGKPDAAFVWSQFQSLMKSNDMNDSKPMQDQINKVLTIIKDVVNGGIKLTEETQALLLMSKVPESYSTMVSAIMATTELSELKIDTLVNKILAEESLRRSGMGQSASKTSQVKPKGNGPCGTCGGRHGSEQCWIKYPHLRPQNKGGKGDKKGKGKGKSNNGNNGNGSKKTNVVHRTQDGQTITVSSTTSGNSSSGSSSGNGASQDTVQEVMCSDPNCKYCGPSSTAGSLVVRPLIITHHKGADSSCNLSTESSNISSMVYASRVNSCDHKQRGRKIDWLMDSGASQSVTNVLNDFWDYTPYKKPVSFGTAGNAIIQAVGSGTVKGFVTVEGGQRVWITLTNVAYIPQASGRLLSTGIVENSGYTLVQGSGSMVVYDQAFTHGTVSGNRVMEALFNPLNNLYYMFMDILDRNVANAMVNPYRIWHRRMGHPSKEVIRRLPDNTKGVDPVGVEDHSPCEGCQWGKSHRAPFPASYKRASKPLELVHTDEDGPMRTQSIEGYRYFITFLDDYTSLG